MPNEDNADQPGFSLDEIRKIADGDKLFVQTLIEAFQTEAEEISKGMEKGLANQDIEQINRLAHKIKPTLQQFEMLALHRQSLELENLEESSDKEEIKNKVEDFVEALSEMKEKVASTKSA